MIKLERKNMKKEIKSPLVVGYKGEIGSFILQGLLRVIPKALNIWCYDINEIRMEQAARIKRADVIFLCVPMEQTINWFIRNAQLLKGKVIIEQCSLKREICNKIKSYEKQFGFTLLSMHILFRPSATPNKEDRTTSLIKHPLWRHYKNTVKKITDSEIKMVNDYEEHDFTMAYQQALVHRVLLVVDNLLKGLPGKTFVSSGVCKLAKRIRGGNPILYSLIQGNKYFPSVLKKFNRELKKFSIEKEIK